MKNVKCEQSFSSVEKKNSIPARSRLSREDPVLVYEGIDPTVGRGKPPNSVGRESRAQDEFPCVRARCVGRQKCERIKESDADWRVEKRWVLARLARLIGETFSLYSYIFFCSVSIRAKGFLLIPTFFSVYHSTIFLISNLCDFPFWIYIPSGFWSSFFQILYTVFFLNQTDGNCNKDRLFNAVKRTKEIASLSL